MSAPSWECCRGSGVDGPCCPCCAAHCPFDGWYCSAWKACHCHADPDAGAQLLAAYEQIADEEAAAGFFRNAAAAAAMTRPCCPACQVWKGRHGAYCADSMCPCHADSRGELR